AVTISPDSRQVTVNVAGDSVQADINTANIDASIVLTNMNTPVPGVDGKSAYQIAVDNGFVGTEAEWISSLQPDFGATAPRVEYYSGRVRYGGPYFATPHGPGHPVTDDIIPAAIFAMPFKTPIRALQFNVAVASSTASSFG